MGRLVVVKFMFAINAITHFAFVHLIYSLARNVRILLMRQGRDVYPEIGLKKLKVEGAGGVNDLFLETISTHCY